jgi:hypothetical protein
LNFEDNQAAEWEVNQGHFISKALEKQRRGISLSLSMFVEVRVVSTRRPGSLAGDTLGFVVPGIVSALPVMVFHHVQEHAWNLLLTSCHARVLLIFGHVRLLLPIFWEGCREKET